jgi:hypothetical protein
LRALLKGDTAEDKECYQNIHAFNNAFAFTSLSVKLDNSVFHCGCGGPYVFTIHGELYHQHGSLIPYREGAPCSSGIIATWLILSPLGKLTMPPRSSPTSHSMYAPRPFVMH